MGRGTIDEVGFCLFYMKFIHDDWKKQMTHMGKWLFEEQSINQDFTVLVNSDNLE